MAGRPQRRHMIEALEKRTRDTFDDAEATPLDYACLWLESGGTIQELAGEVCAKTQSPKTAPAVLSRYLREFDGGEDRLEESRRRAADAHVELSLRIADEDCDKDGAARQRNRIGVRQWLAERANRPKFGQHMKIEQNISVTALHLNALRHRVAAAPIAPQLPPTVEAEVLSIEEKTGG